MYAGLRRETSYLRDSHACDFSGIEAVLVGYEAQDPGYIRLARKDVHSFYTAYALNMLDPGRMLANDLPLLSWDDEKLFGRLAEIKREFKWDRNTLYKHLVHAINFGQEAKGARTKIHKDTGIFHELRLLKQLMSLYREELFPSIPKWQTAIRQQADKDGYLKNAFGYVHTFHAVYEMRKHRVGTVNGEGGEVVWNSHAGPDASKVLAFKPQSTAAGILKEAMLRLFEERWEEVGQYLRLTLHDELWAEAPEDKAAEVVRVMEEEMGKPIPQLALPAHYNLGPFLSIEVESKIGKTWSAME